MEWEGGTGTVGVGRAFRLALQSAWGDERGGRRARGVGACGIAPRTWAFGVTVGVVCVFEV